MGSLDVLMPIEGMGLIGEMIDARLPLHRLWLEPNPHLWLAEWRPRIRAIALAGHVRADEAYMRQFPNLEIISSFGVGYDHIDGKAAARSASSPPIRRACLTTRSPTPRSAS